MKRFVLPLLSLPLFAVPAFATVTITSPVNQTTISSNVQFSATGQTTCKRGVSAMGIYVDNKLAYTVTGASVDTSLTLPVGAHNASVTEWDYCGSSSNSPVQLTVSDQTGVFVALPNDYSTVGGKVNFMASALSSCAKGVASMGVYVNDKLVSVSKGAVYNQQLDLANGTPKVVVQSWDYCGASSKKQVPMTVDDGDNSQGGISHTFHNIQAYPNWDQWGEFAPVYDICLPCDGINWNVVQHQKAVSLSGDATEFSIGGTSRYADVLFSNKLIGQLSTQNMPDKDRKILPNIHHMVYNADVYVTNAAVTQDLEFDANIFMDGASMEWGTQCNELAEGQWDIWDNVNAHWIATGVPCKLVDKAWNHVSFEVERLSDNSLLYKSVTLNGVTSLLNRVYPAAHAPASWYGMNVNYQMDGNYKMASYTTYLDNLTLKYW